MKKLPKWDHPLAVPNQQHAQGMLANYRTAGLADMATAIAEGRPHRCSLEAALHAVEIMTGILKSGETGKFVAMADHLRKAGGARHRRGQGAPRQKALAWQERLKTRRDKLLNRRSAPNGADLAFFARGDDHELATRRQPLRNDGLQPVRPLRPEAAGDLARPLAQFRRRHAA